jgi:hypothetical protein
MARLISLISLSVLLVPVLLTLPGCGCGFDCNDDNDNDQGIVTLGFSDAPIDDVEEVLLVVDTITFRRSNGVDVIVDNFTIPELNLVDAETFDIDLLDYPGISELEVISDLEMENDSYSSIVLDIIDGDINQSFVRDIEGVKQLNARSSQVVLPGIGVTRGAQGFTVEFSLAQSLQYLLSSDSYELTSEGIRVEDSDSGSISGRVESELFDLDSPCDSKTDPLAGNRLYLYSGINLDRDNLADVFTSSSRETIPDDAIAPFAVANVVSVAGSPTANYVFAFIPEGGYTLVFSCEAEDDDPVDYNGFAVPSPVGQLYEVDLGDGELALCDLAVDASCS